jgi:hypothetical protein
MPVSAPLSPPSHPIDPLHLGAALRLSTNFACPQAWTCLGQPNVAASSSPHPTLSRGRGCERSERVREFPNIYLLQEVRLGLEQSRKKSSMASRLLREDLLSRAIDEGID